MVVCDDTNNSEIRLKSNQLHRVFAIFLKLNIEVQGKELIKFALFVSVLKVMITCVPSDVNWALFICGIAGAEVRGRMEITWEAVALQRRKKISKTLFQQLSKT